MFTFVGVFMIVELDNMIMAAWGSVERLENGRCWRYLRHYPQARGGYVHRLATIRNPRDLSLKPYAPAELQRQAAFRSAVAASQDVYASPTLLRQFQLSFARQRKYKTLRGYIIASLYKSIS